MTVSVEDFLAHHGVKGQKWGVRKREDDGPGLSSGQKKAVIIGGAVAASAAVAGSIWMAKRYGTNVKADLPYVPSVEPKEVFRNVDVPKIDTPKFEAPKVNLPKLDLPGPYASPRAKRLDRYILNDPRNKPEDMDKLRAAVYKKLKDLGEG